MRHDVCDTEYRAYVSQARTVRICSELAAALGFDLDAYYKKRASACAIASMLCDQQPYAATKERGELKRLKKLQGDLTCAGAAVLARELTTRELLERKAESFVVLCSYHIMAQMLQQSRDTGQVCIAHVNPAQAEHFAMGASALEARSPSLVAYTARVARAFDTMDGAPLRWARTEHAVASSIAEMAKRHRLAKWICLDLLADQGTWLQKCATGGASAHL
jgi:hypothetical protein